MSRDFPPTGGSALLDHWSNAQGTHGTILLQLFAILYTLALATLHQMQLGFENGILCLHAKLMQCSMDCYYG